MMPKNKLQHALGSAGLMLCLYLVLLIPVAPIWQAVIATLGIGAAKEGWDAMGHGTAEWWDFGADCVGVLAAAVLICISSMMI